MTLFFTLWHVLTQPSETHISESSLIKYHILTHNSEQYIFFYSCAATVLYILLCWIDLICAQPLRLLNTVVQWSWLLAPVSNRWDCMNLDWPLWSSKRFVIGSFRSGDIIRITDAQKVLQCCMYVHCYDVKNGVQNCDRCCCLSWRKHINSCFSSLRQFNHQFHLHSIWCTSKCWSLFNLLPGFIWSSKDNANIFTSLIEILIN